MHYYPSLEEFRAYSKKGNLIPVTADLMADFETPVSVYTKLKAAGEPAFLLESIDGGAHLNRYSFIGCQPRTTLSMELGGTSTITHRDGSTETLPTPPDPLTLLKREMDRYNPVTLPDMPRFVGGAVGYLAYDFVHTLEPSVPLPRNRPLDLPVAHFLITDTLVIFDRARQTLRLLVNAHVADSEEIEDAYTRALDALQHLAYTLSQPVSLASAIAAPNRHSSIGMDVPPGNFSKEAFERMVVRCKEYIRAGDVIQVVGSQRFELDFDRDPMDLYRALRIVNPSPYMFLYDPGQFALVGASPEVHVRLTEGLAEVRPIAGTRPRGLTSTEDLAFEEDLLADEKERAEHLMLVDLARNDLGRVCQFGTVHVTDYMTVERYSHVMHIVSQVAGRIRPECDAYALMRATFPAGTVSGAPKVRAMQIIAEQENQQRGPYAGALCYFSYDGNLDSCIAIRTATLKDQKLFIQSGAGLVADSSPASEYEETINKAKGMLRAVHLAQSLPR